VNIDLGAGTASGGGDLGIGSATLISIEDAVGGQYDDRITGSAGANHLYGRGGNDTLFGGAGADTLDGGSGNDVLLGESNATDLTLTGFGGPVTFVNGETIKDVLVGGEGDDFMDGGIGDDTMIGGSGNDTYVASTGDVVTELPGEGVDTLLSYASYVLPADVENLSLLGGVNASGTGNALDNQLIGNAGRNTLSGGAGNDTLDGGFDNDLLDGGAGVDRVFGNEGDDRIVLASAADLAAGESIDGGNGSDTLFYTGTAALQLTANVTGIETIKIAEVDAFGTYGTWGTTAIDADASQIGGTSGVMLYGNDGDNVLTGTSYDDMLFAGAGNDVVSAGAGRDIVSAGRGDDVLIGGDGDDTLDGGDGNDSYYVAVGDQIFDASGNDTVYASGSHELEAGMENLTATGAAATSFQGNNLTGVMTGNDSNNYFNPRAGDDTLIGNDGSDYFDMSTGGTSTPGTRFLDGGSGTDTVDYDGYARSAVTIDLAAGAASGGGDLGAGAATLVSVERAVGGAFGDRITGSSAANELFGRGGNDSLFGGAGNDTLWGGVGDDTLSGGSGDDVLVGSYGNDTYVFCRGDGSDILRENARGGDGWWFDNPTVGNSDVVQFGAGISADQIWLARSGDNLVASVIGTPDQLVVENWYLGGDNRVEQFRTDAGNVLVEGQVQNLVNAMAAFAPPAQGVTTLPAGYAVQLDALIAANWQ
jgi:Ca2+-binding RTX toxin-like protein